jgi:hypothetical protein
LVYREVSRTSAACYENVSLSGTSPSTFPSEVTFDYRLDLLEYTYAWTLYAWLFPHTVSSIRPTQTGDDVAVLVFGRIHLSDDVDFSVCFDGLPIKCQTNYDSQIDHLLFDAFRSLNTDLKPWIMEKHITISDDGPSIKSRLFSDANFIKKRGLERYII